MRRWALAVAAFAACKGGATVDRSEVERIVSAAGECKDSACVNAQLDKLLVLQGYRTLTAKDDHMMTMTTLDMVRFKQELQDKEMHLSRHEIFFTGFTACRTAMADVRSSPEQTRAMEKLRDANAKRIARIGVTWPAYPQPGGTDLDEMRAILDWHLAAMTALDKELADVPSNHALVALAVDTCALLIAYTPEGPVDESIHAVEKHAKQANIDPKSVTTLVDALRARPDLVAAQDAVLAFDREVAKALEGDSKIVWPPHVADP